MKRETLEMLMSTVNELQRPQFLDALPHGAAKTILMRTKDVIDIVLDAEFEGQEIMFHCEGCQQVLLSDDEILSDESGDCHFCKKCVDEWQAEQDKKLDQDIAAKATETNDPPLPAHFGEIHTIDPERE